MPSRRSTSGSGVYSTRQSVHTRRTSRWASTPISEAETLNGSIPISVRRVIAPAASFVWSVAISR